MNTAATLNQIATLLNTTDKSLVINVAIKTLMDMGLPVDQAMDAVCGEGAYKRLASQVYHQLRGEA